MHREHERVQLRGVVIDLDMLHGRSAKAIRDRVGRRGLIIPMCSFSDTLTKERSSLGTRFARFAKAHGKVKALALQHGVPIRLPDWNQNMAECCIDEMDFLSKDAADIWEVVEPRMESHLRQMRGIAECFERGLRDSVREALAIEDQIEQWLARWSNESLDESRGRLARWMASQIAPLEVQGVTPLLRAMALVATVRFFHRYGRRDEKTVPPADRLISDCYDLMYLVWALRFEARLWTGDGPLVKLCTMSKRVARFAGLDWKD